VDYGGRFAGDGAFVDRGHAFDDFAVDGDHVACFDQDDVAFAQVTGGDRQPGGAVFRVAQLLGHRRLLEVAQRGRLGLAAAFGQRFGKVGEQDREPQPDADGQDKAGTGFTLGKQRLDEQQRRDDAADENDEHDRAAHLRAWGQLPEGVDNGRFE
jgi:hypothetical protein